MHRLCVIVVDGVGEICVKLMGFYPAMIYIIRGVEKQLSFTAKFSRLLHNFFHSKNQVFQSVSCEFLPIFNKTNNNNNKVILNINSNWRILV